MQGNATPDSILMTAIKGLVTLLPPAERARFRPWLLARYDVQGYEAVGFAKRRE